MVGSKGKMFKELKYDPVKPRLKMGLKTELKMEPMRTLDQMFAPKARREVKLNSIIAMRREIARNESKSLREFFSKASIVGFMNLNAVIYEYNTDLYSVSLFYLVKSLMYQIILKDFSNFDRMKQRYQCNMEKIERFAPMMKDYFEIDFTASGINSMPRLVKGYIPAFSSIQLFVNELTTGITLDSEVECFTNVANSLSSLYSIHPSDTAHEEQIQSVFSTVLMPMIRSEEYIPQTSFEPFVHKL